MTEASRPERLELPFNDTVTEFDAAEAILLIEYARYMEKQSPQQMRAIQRASTNAFDAFGEVISEVMKNHSGVISEDARPGIMATLVCNMAREHTRLLADYTDYAEVSTDDEVEGAIESLTSLFETFDDETLVEAVLDHFREAREADMEIIEHFVINRVDSPIERAKTKFVKESLDVAKIGGGVLTALIVFDKFFK